MLALRSLLHLENPFRYLIDGGACLLTRENQSPIVGLASAVFVAFNTHVLPPDTTPHERAAASDVIRSLQLVGGVGGLGNSVIAIGGGGSGGIVDVGGGGGGSNYSRVHLQRALPLVPDAATVLGHRQTAHGLLTKLLASYITFLSSSASTAADGTLASAGGADEKDKEQQQGKSTASSVPTTAAQINNMLSLLTLRPLARFAMVDREHILRSAGGCSKSLVRDNASAVARAMVVEMGPAAVMQLLSGFFSLSSAGGASSTHQRPSSSSLSLLSAPSSASTGGSRNPSLSEIAMALSPSSSTEGGSSSSSAVAAAAAPLRHAHHVPSSGPSAAPAGPTPRIVSDAVQWNRVDEVVPKGAADDDAERPTKKRNKEKKRLEAAAAAADASSAAAVVATSAGANNNNNNSSANKYHGLTGDAAAVADCVGALRHQYEWEEKYYARCAEWRREATTAMRAINATASSSSSSASAATALPPLPPPPPVAPQPLVVWAQLHAAAGKAVGGVGAPFSLTKWDADEAEAAAARQQRKRSSAATDGSGEAVPPSASSPIVEDEEQYRHRNLAAIEATVNQPLLAIVDALPPSSLLLVVAADCRANNGNRLSKAHGALVAMIKGDGGAGDVAFVDPSSSSSAVSSANSFGSSGGPRRPKRGTTEAYRASVAHLLNGGGAASSSASAAQKGAEGGGGAAASAASSSANHACANQ